MAGSPTSLCKEKVITYAALSSQFALWVSDGPEICSLSFVSLLHSEKRCCLQAVPGGICSPFLSLPFFFWRGLVPEERALFPLNIRNGPEPKRGSEEKGKALSREATRRRTPLAAYDGRRCSRVGKTDRCYMPKAALNLIFCAYGARHTRGCRMGRRAFFYVPLARVGDTLRREECFLTRQVLWRRMVGRSPPALADGGPAAYMDLSPVLEDTRSPLSFL